RGQASVEVIQREAFGERVEDGPGDVVAGPELDELRAERTLVVPRRRRAIARDQARTQRIKRDRRGSVDQARPKLDRRDVPFSDGPQAHDESVLAGAHARLV